MLDDLDTKIVAMRAGGKRLRHIKKELEQFSQVGVSFEAIESEAQRLIKEAGAKPNFAMVPGYSWATCLMKNDELCHGIPKNKVVADGDVITIDVGLYYQGYHLDTSISFGAGKLSGEAEHFLSVGRQSLKKAIFRVKPGASIYDISHAMQKIVERAGYSVVYQLTGHTIGKELHMEPSIPCFAQKSDKKRLLSVGDTIAVESMYTAGNAYLTLDEDGWTYRTADGSLGAMFEETVLVTQTGFEILT